MRYVQRLLTFHEEVTGLEAPYKIWSYNGGVVEDVMLCHWVHFVTFEEL